MTGESSQGEPPANTGRDQAGRFKTGHSGNPLGPKPGYRHKATMAAENLLLADIEEVAKTVVREAKAGAHWACRLVIMAVLPPARECLTPFQLPEIAGPADLPDAVMTVIEAAASGEITLAEAERVTRLLEGLRLAYETRDLASEVEAMRAEVEALREHGNGGARTWR